MLLAKLLPAFDEPVGALERVDADFRFDLHRADSLMAAPLCCLADQFRIIAECAVEVGGALGPDRVQSIAGAVQRLALVGHRVDTLRAWSFGKRGAFLYPDRIRTLYVHGRIGCGGGRNQCGGGPAIGRSEEHTSELPA